jgi:hypothetical protein
VSQIDVSRYLDQMESTLQKGDDPERCKEIMIILRRWEGDEALEPACARRVKSLLDTFQTRFWP